jgi:hypothetical protein
MPYFQPTTLTFTALDQETGEVPVDGVPVDVSCDVTSAQVTNETPLETRETLCGKHPIVGESAETLEVTADQYWKPAEALSRFLEEHHGELAAFELAWPAQDLTVTGTVRVIRGQIGGEAGAIVETTVELPVQGATVKVYGPVVPLEARSADAEDAEAAA